MPQRPRFVALLCSALLIAVGSVSAGPPFPWRSSTMGPAPYSQRQAARLRGTPQPALSLPPPAPTPLEAPDPAPRVTGPQRVLARKPGSSLSAGAGIHLTASQRFLDELIRFESQDAGPVRDCILGAEVVGSQSTETVVHIRLLPDPDVARLDLILQGTTRNSTENRTPQAVIQSEGNHRFDVAKTVQFDGQTLLTRSPSAWLYPCQRNRAALTPASAIPILGPLVSQYALGMAEQRRPEAEQIAAQRITRQVAPKFDESIDARLVSLNRTLQEVLPRELPKFGIEHPLTRARTTANELQVSLAWDSVQSVPEYQLPVLAPDDSQLHLAVHAAAVNAWLNRLPLAGREIAIRDLSRWQSELQRLLAQGAIGHEVTRPAATRSRRTPVRTISEPTLLPGLGEPTILGPILPPPREPTRIEETQKVPTFADPVEPVDDPQLESATADLGTMVLSRSQPISVEFQHNAAVITLVAAFKVEPAPQTEEHRLRIPLTSRIQDNVLIVTPGLIEVENAAGSTGAFSSVVRNSIETQVRQRIQPTRWPLERQFVREAGGPVTLKLQNLSSDAGWLSFGWTVQGDASRQTAQAR